MSQTRSFKPSPLIHFSNSHYNTHTVYTYTSKFCGNTCQSFMDIFMFLVVESCLTLCNPMDYSMPRFPVLHHLPEFAQTMPTESVMLSNHLILYHSLFLLPSIFPSIRVFFPVSRLFASGGQRIDAFELWCWRRLLRVLWAARRSNQSTLKEISPEYSLKGLMKPKLLILWSSDAKNLLV